MGMEYRIVIPGAVSTALDIGQKCPLGQAGFGVTQVASVVLDVNVAGLRDLR